MQHLTSLALWPSMCWTSLDNESRLLKEVEHMLQVFTSLRGWQTCSCMMQHLTWVFGSCAKQQHI